MNSGDAEDEIVIPVIAEQLNVNAVPVSTGGVRIIKRVIGNEESIEQELRKETVDIRRVKVNRTVDGPQPVTQIGNTLIVPIVEETLRIERQWVVTEEVHISRREEKTCHQEKVVLQHEEVGFERFEKGAGVTPPVPSAAGRNLSTEEDKA